MNQLKGINLSLMIGPGIAIPAPKIVVDALTSVQVTGGKDRSGFQISFTVGKNSPLITTLLPSGFFDPIITRVGISVIINGVPTQLMDGLITNQEFAPSNEAGKTTLTITGSDMSVAMDLIERKIPFPALPVIGRVYAILAPYLALGVVPVAIPPISFAFKSPTAGWESQNGQTDKGYLSELAQQHGYIFMVQPGPAPGTSVAYFGPDVNLPHVQKALSINFDGASNAESLSFSLDGMAKKVQMVTILDPFTKKIPIPVPIPNVNLLKPPMGLRITPPSKVEFSKDLTKKTATEAASDIIGFMLNNSNSITANGAFDTTRYGTVLRPRMMVGVRGAGVAYDGLYYVESVTHNIKKGEYKQNFSLSRDGLISNTGFVSP